MHAATARLDISFPRAWHSDRNLLTCSFGDVTCRDMKMEIGLMSKAMQRARRAARAVLHGPKILDFMTSDRARALLISAAQAGHPPVAAVSGELVRLVGLKDAKLTPVKQYVGACIRAVLDEEGFEVAETGVRLSGDPIFRTGAVYRKATAQPASSAHDVLRRWLGALTDEEAALALRILEARVRGATP
jgi:hypothetical protein